MISELSELSKVNEIEILSEASEIFEQKKDLMVSANLNAEKILPYYKKMYQMAAEYPLDLKRKF